MTKSNLQFAFTDEIYRNITRLSISRSSARPYLLCVHLYAFLCTRAQRDRINDRAFPQISCFCARRGDIHISPVAHFGTALLEVLAQPSITFTISFLGPHERSAHLPAAPPARPFVRRASETRLSRCDAVGGAPTLNHKYIMRD